MAAGPADAALDTFKTLVWDVLVKALEDALVAAIPFATWGWFSWLAGPLGFLIDKLISWVTDRLYLYIKDTINLEVIMLTNEAHHQAYLKASQDLQGAFDKYGPGSQQFKALRQAHQAALAKFVRWSGTGSSAA